MLFSDDAAVAIHVAPPLPAPEDESGARRIEPLAAEPAPGPVGDW